MTPEQLEAIEGIGPKTVEKISLAVNNYFASLEAGGPVASEGDVSAEGVSAEDEAVAEESTPETVEAAASEGEQATEAEAESVSADEEHESERDSTRHETTE
jgi:transcription termination/antitermination protein NusA